MGREILLNQNRDKPDKPIKWITMNPPQILALGFLGLIMIGTILLMLPIATQDRHHLSFIDALFEATSAVCVTGLVVVDTATTFTTFGEIVIMLLIQVGGWGFMTVGIFIAIYLGKTIGLKQRIMIQESLNQFSLSGLIRLVKFVVGFTLLTEGIGAMILAVRWAGEFGWQRSLYYGLFHSISAFNNAGFDLMGGFSSLTHYVGDATIVLTISSLFIIGGIGFTVIVDIVQRKPYKRWSLHTKLVLLMTLILNLSGMIAIFTLEYHNPGTLGNLAFEDKVTAAYFHGVVPRTAGFNTLDMTELTMGSQIVTMFLMFVGGGPGGTAGGIKVTTFILLLAAVWSIITLREDVNIMKRRLPQNLIYKALSIAMISCAVIILAVFILSITEQAPLNMILFEVISAFGTVGMSLGLTPELSTAGKCVIAVMMFIGRVGPLTLFFSLTKRHKQSFRYAEEKIWIG